MEARELFELSLNQATKTFDQLQASDFAKPTPDSEWNVRSLATHMLYELSWIPDILAGKRTEDVGTKYDGDLLGIDAALSWHMAAGLAKGEVSLADLKATAHLSYGNVSNEEYIRQVAGDLLIHSWDLAAALGISRELDPRAVQVVCERMQATANDLQATGLFAPPLDAPKSADIQTKLLALVGRDAGWKTPG